MGARALELGWVVDAAVFDCFDNLVRISQMRHVFAGSRRQSL